MASRTGKLVAKTLRRRPDLGTIAGLALAGASLLGGFLLEEGTLHEIARFSPFLIVLGGTCGAVLASFPLQQIRRAVSKIPDLLFPHEETGLRPLMDELLSYSRTARRHGLLALEDAKERISDSFLKKGLELAIDGAGSSEIRRVMELESMVEQERLEEEARVFESAGGYAPTIGIVGAVLGLIIVMKHIDATDKIGPGIAVAFTATIYGVGSANLVFLPCAKKIRARARALLQRREFILQGVCAIADGLNPRVSERILEAFLQPERSEVTTAPGAPLVKTARETLQ